MLSDELGISIDAINNKLNGYTLLNINEMKHMVTLFNMKPVDINKYFIGSESVSNEEKYN